VSVDLDESMRSDIEYQCPRSHTLNGSNSFRAQPNYQLHRRTSQLHHLQHRPRLAREQHDQRGALLVAARSRPEPGDRGGPSLVQVDAVVGGHPDPVG
jgi:hypothetical protein